MLPLIDFLLIDWWDVIAIHIPSGPPCCQSPEESLKFTMRNSSIEAHGRERDERAKSVSFVLEDMAPLMLMITAPRYHSNRVKSLQHL